MFSFIKDNNKKSMVRSGSFRSIAGLSIICIFIVANSVAQKTPVSFPVRADSVATHKVVLDNQSRIISWITPQSRAYDQFLRQRWNFIKTRVPMSPGAYPVSSYPQYYFYCAFWDRNGTLEPDTWMNDVGEKIPNWFESARLYYAYTGDTSVMNIVMNLINYTIEHGTSPSGFVWPDFPYTTTNAGDTEFRGFTSYGRFVMHEVQVDHAGDMGLTFYRLYQYTGDEKYKTAAVHIANTLVSKIRNGNAAQSPWPYLVVMNTGDIVSEYGANWIGCYSLLNNLAVANIGNVAAYREACEKVRDFMLHFPMRTGYWTDGHTDNDIRSNRYKSNMSASNTGLYMLDHPEFDPDWRIHIPGLIKWTEDNFVFRCQPGEPATMWGANLVGEQDTVLIKMDYQTARYAAACAKWYAASGDESYKEKAYRALNWVTYCSDSTGKALESPVSNKWIASNWWSDCYGECPRMFYHAFAGIPEWAPPHENHILYSEGILRDVQYDTGRVEFTATSNNGTEYLRLTFRPARITLNGQMISFSKELKSDTFIVRNLGNGDYAITIRHTKAGELHIYG
jgi:hypothetical protein